MVRVSYKRYVLRFREAAGTSRGTLLQKTSYFLFLSDPEIPERIGIGECAVLPGLSPDEKPGLEEELERLSREGLGGSEDLLRLKDRPALRFGLEMALIDLEQGGRRLLFPSGFTQGTSTIPINGLVWMGSREKMLRQIGEKIAAGYKVIKLKIGAIGFEEELSLLAHIRENFSKEEITIRLDANGAFEAASALEKLKRLAEYDIHSVEQAVKAGQWDEMARLCRTSPIPLALDEELIGLTEDDDRRRMMDHIRPQYLILKPTLTGGFAASGEWIRLAEEYGAGWWVTSALESNIGLSALAQWTAVLGNSLPQGLGTGGLYTNNVVSPLVIRNGQLCYDPAAEWDLSVLQTG